MEDLSLEPLRGITHDPGTFSMYSSYLRLLVIALLLFLVVVTVV